MTGQGSRSKASETEQAASGKRSEARVQSEKLMAALMVTGLHIYIYIYVYA